MTKSVIPSIFLLAAVAASRPAHAASAEDEAFLEDINAVTARVFDAMNNAPGVLARIQVLERLMPEYIGNSSVRNFLLQMLGTEYSFAGQHMKALQAFDEQSSFGPLLVDEVTALRAHDAVDAILTHSATRQILMINEAHHVAQHRVLTYRLLEGLWAQGYRYFAAEAFGKDAEVQLEADGYATESTGYYIHEPLFTNLVLYAKALGFTLVSYDYEPSRGTEERETNAARIIEDKIFARDPQARVIIHVGYSHIDEQSWLAHKLTQNLGIDPLTVNHTDLAEKSNADDEPQSYTWLMENVALDAPGVLLDSAGQPWSLKPEVYDFNVIWPRTRYENGRPTWAALNRTARPVDRNWCRSRFPCTVEVLHHGEAAELPTDRIVLDEAAASVSIFLSPGTNIITATNAAGERLHTEQVDVPTR